MGTTADAEGRSLKRYEFDAARLQSLMKNVPEVHVCLADVVFALAGNVEFSDRLYAKAVAALERNAAFVLRCEQRQTTVEAVRGDTTRACPSCGHSTPHKNEVCYCEVPGCDCDRTDVPDFYELHELKQERRDFREPD